MGGSDQSKIMPNQWMYDLEKGVFAQTFVDNMPGGSTWMEAQPQFHDYTRDSTFQEAHLLTVALCIRDT